MNARYVWSLLAAVWLYLSMVQFGAVLLVCRLANLPTQNSLACAGLSLLALAAVVLAVSLAMMGYGRKVSERYCRFRSAEAGQGTVKAYRQSSDADYIGLAQLDAIEVTAGLGSHLDLVSRL